MAFNERQLLDGLSRTPFVDSMELEHILGEPHATVHRIWADPLAEGIVGRANHGTAHLPSSQRYHLTAQGIRETADFLGIDTPSDFVRAYPMSREWLTLLIRRMDAIASVYRLAGAQFPGRLPPPQTQLEHPPQPAQPPCLRQCRRQRLPPPPQMVLPARCVQGFRLRRQRQAEVPDHGDLQLPTARRSLGPVESAALRVVSGPKPSPLGHQRGSRAEGALLVRLVLQCDHPGIGHPMTPSWRPPLLALSTVGLGGIGFDLLPFLVLRCAALWFQPRQLLCLLFDGLLQSTILFLQRRHPFFQRRQLFRNVTGVITGRVIAVNSGRAPILLQRLSHTPGYVAGVVARRQRAVVHPQSL